MMFLCDLFKFVITLELTMNSYLRRFYPRERFLVFSVAGNPIPSSAAQQLSIEKKNRKRGMPFHT